MSFQYDSFIPFILLALAVGMDAFSVSLSIGFMKKNMRPLVLFIALVGAFHVLMPFLGMTIGHMLSHKLGVIAQIVGGWMLIIIGAQMIVATVLEKNMLDQVRLAGLILIAFTVSLDSFSVGLSIGMFGVNQFAIIMMFGIVSMILAGAGIYLAKKGRFLFGKYSEAFGGAVLLVLGLQMIY
ncbi:hypothetical protein CEY16_07330 [Halalkalibacillus sediminis]|uniref:Manganese efflux pump MntP n=1 Tax=Halalkalibacillus sediminis TaxID=2018042 RepID=A0A2I0QTR0_9BACI|nr:manganese efflux pump [Halalkalibacillus sediminis]PKR77735.1 hypothetical protein CEY16_07330 [Halalkalibacillus sediminis]